MRPRGRALGATVVLAAVTALAAGCELNPPSEPPSPPVAEQAPAARIQTTAPGGRLILDRSPPAAAVWDRQRLTIEVGGELLFTLTTELRSDGRRDVQMVYGPGVKGIRQTNLTMGTDGMIEGTIDGRAIVPVSARSREVTLAFADGGPAPTLIAPAGAEAVVAQLAAGLREQLARSPSKGHHGQSGPHLDSGGDAVACNRCVMGCEDSYNQCNAQGWTDCLADLIAYPVCLLIHWAVCVGEAFVCTAQCARSAVCCPDCCDSCCPAAKAPACGGGSP
jgi:hypothetical protein